MHGIFIFADISMAAIGLEEELERLRKERDQLNQERSRILESERKAGEELKARNRELTGKTRLVERIKNSLFLWPVIIFPCFALVVVLKANTKKHLEDLVKDRDSWKSKCLQIWRGVAPVLDLISPELPEDQPRAQSLGLVEKEKRTWGWLQQFVKDTREYIGAHVLSMVRAHYPLIDLSRL